MKLTNKRLGRPGVFVPDLIFWEHEWHWVFHGLAFGVPARSRTQRVWEPVLGPKLLVWKPESTRPRGFAELDEERVIEWNAKPECEKWRQVEYRDHIPEIPAEPRVWSLIKVATSSSQIRAAFELSSMWLNAGAHGRLYVDELRGNAEEFLACKKYRYPRSERPSSESKRVLHFARAMAGIMEGVGSVRAIDLIRLQEHGTPCGCVECEIKKC